MINNHFTRYFYYIAAFAFIAGCMNHPSNIKKTRIVNQLDTTYRSTTPEPRSIEHSWMSVEQWYKRHNNHLTIAQNENPELLFLGDSITESWSWGEGRSDIYQTYFSQYKAANFAIGGDMTQNLLWRLQHGIKGNITPKVAVLMIGTNNFLHQNQPPIEVAAGVKSVITQIQKNYPAIKILTIGILPLHQNSDNTSRKSIHQTNKLISQFADNQSVFFINFSDEFLDTQGQIPQSLMADYIHPTAKGLDIVAKNISPVLLSWLGK